MKDSQVKTVNSKSSQQTFNLGTNLGNKVDQGICIALKGELGVGKTTFVQGFAKGLKVSEKYYITSPTFSIINEYPTQVQAQHQSQSPDEIHSLMNPS